MKKIVYIIALFSFSISAFAAERTPAQWQCTETFRKALSKYSTAALVLLDKLTKEGRVSTDNIDELDRITKPAYSVLGQLHVICADESIDSDQAALITETFGDKDCSK